MAKIVYACVRDIAIADLIKKRIGSIMPMLVPDNIPTAPCKVVQKGQIIYGISTYTPAIAEKDDCVCMGLTYESNEKWWLPQNGHPEGTYAIFRANEEFVETVTDIACTRGIWYYKDDTIFIAGTSQRAVTALAGKFDFDRRNIPWMLSAGIQAPTLSWNKNLGFVNPEGTVLLDRKTWEISTKSIKPDFKPSMLPEKEFQEQFKQTLISSFKKITIDLSQWTLPISGGYDSRGIACLLKEAGKDITRLNAITWGLQASLQNIDSDGYIGGIVSKALGMQHKFWPTNDTSESIEKIFERFLRCGEGRIDHIGGYTDGMAIWKNIFHSGKYGILRGDESFGGSLSNTYFSSRLKNEYRFCSDFSNLENFEQQYGFEKQLMPEQFEAMPDKETPAVFRDRLNQEFEIPFTLSPLSDIKFAFTEILNPLLTKEIIKKSRTIPDKLRNDRKLYINTINALSPKIPFATKKSVALRQDILLTPDAIKVLVAEISAPYMKELFPVAFLSKVLDKLQAPSSSKKKGLVYKIKYLLINSLPIRIKETLRKNMPKPAVDAGMLAFRVYITGKMYKIFTEDARQLEAAMKD